jgi:hypothetical protein
MKEVTDQEALKAFDNNISNQGGPSGASPEEERDSGLSEELGVGMDALGNTFDAFGQVYKEGMNAFEQGPGSFLSNQGTSAQERYTKEAEENTASRYNLAKNKKKTDEEMANLDATGQYVAMAPSLAANIAPAFIPGVGIPLAAAIGSAQTVGEIAADDISKGQKFDYSELATAGAVDAVQNAIGAKYLPKLTGGGKKFDKAGKVIDDGSIARRIAGEGVSGSGTSVGSELIFNWATDRALTDNLGQAALVGGVLGSGIKGATESVNLKNMDWENYKPLKAISNKFAGSKFKVDDDVKDRVYKGMTDNASFEQELKDIKSGKSDKNPMDVAEDFYSKTKGNKAKAAFEAISLLDKNGFKGTDAMFGGEMSDGTKVGELFNVPESRVVKAQKIIKQAVHGLVSSGGTTTSQHLSDIKVSADKALQSLRGSITEAEGTVQSAIEVEKKKGSEGSDIRIDNLKRLRSDLEHFQSSLGKIMNRQGLDTADSTKMLNQAQSMGEMLVRTGMLDTIRGQDGGIFNPREIMETAYAIDSMAASEHPSYRQSVADPQAGLTAMDAAAPAFDMATTGGLPIATSFREGSKFMNRRDLSKQREKGKSNQQKVVSDLAELRTKTMKPTNVDTVLSDMTDTANQELAADGFNVDAPDATKPSDLTREQRVSGLRDLGYDNDAEVESIISRMEELDKMQQDKISADPVKAEEDIAARRDKLKEMGYTDNQINTLEPTLRGEKLPTVDPKIAADKGVEDAKSELDKANKANKVTEMSLEMADKDYDDVKYNVKDEETIDSAVKNVDGALEAHKKTLDDVAKKEDALKFAEDSRSKLDEPEVKPEPVTKKTPDAPVKPKPVKSEGDKAVEDIATLRKDTQESTEAPKEAPKDSPKKSTPLPTKSVKTAEVVPATKKSIANLVPSNLIEDVEAMAAKLSTNLSKSFPTWDKARIEAEASEAIGKLMDGGFDYRDVNKSDVQRVMEQKRALETLNNSAKAKPIAKALVNTKRSSQEIVSSMLDDATVLGFSPKVVQQYMKDNGITPDSVKESQYNSIMKGAATEAKLSKEYKQTPSRIKNSVKGHTPEQLDRAYTEKGFSQGDDVSIKDSQGITKELAKIVRTDAEKEIASTKKDAKDIDSKSESKRKELKRDQEKANNKAESAAKAEDRATEKALKDRTNKQAQADKATASKAAKDAKADKVIADKAAKDFDDETSAQKKEVDGLVNKSDKLTKEIDSLADRSESKQNLIDKEEAGIANIRANNMATGKVAFNQMPAVQRHRTQIEFLEKEKSIIDRNIDKKSSELDKTLGDLNITNATADSLVSAREAEAKIESELANEKVINDLIDENGMSELREQITADIDPTLSLDKQIAKLNSTIKGMATRSRNRIAELTNAVKAESTKAAEATKSSEEFERLYNALEQQKRDNIESGDTQGVKDAEAAIKAVEEVGHKRKDIRTDDINRIFNKWSEVGVTNRKRYPDNPELWLPTDAKREMNDLLKGTESGSGVGDWHQNLRSDIFGNRDVRPKYNQKTIDDVLGPAADRGELGPDGDFTSPVHPGLASEVLNPVVTSSKGDRRVMDGVEYEFDGKKWNPVDDTPPPSGPKASSQASSPQANTKPKVEPKKAPSEPVKAPEPKPKKAESTQDFYNRVNKLPEEDVYAIKEDEEMYGALSPAKKGHVDKLISDYDTQADAEGGMTQAQKDFYKKDGWYVNEKMADVMSDGDVKKAFEKLDKAGVANKGTKTLVKRLSQVLPKDVRLFMTNMSDAYGAYNVSDNPKDRYIRLVDDIQRRSHGQDKDSMERTLVHEGVHAATSHIIKDVNSGKGNYSKGQKQAVDKLNTLFKDTKAHIEANGDQDKFPKFHAMFADIDEFVTYSMMDPDVQKALNDIQLHNSPDKSVMSQFLEDIAQILGMPLNQKSVLAEVVNIGDDMLKFTGGDKGALSKYDTSVKDTNDAFFKMKPKKKTGTETLSEVDKLVATEKEKLNSLSDELDYIEAKMKHEEDIYDRDSSTAVDRDDATKALKSLNNDKVRLDSEHIQAVKEYEDAYRKAAQDVTKAKVNPVKASPVVTKVAPKAAPKRGKKLTGPEKAIREMSLKDIDDLLSSPTGKKLPADKIKTFTDEIDRRLNPKPVAPAAKKKKTTTTPEREAILTMDNSDTSEGDFDPLAELDKIMKQGTKKKKDVPSEVIQTPAEQIAFRKGISSKIKDGEALTEAEFDFVKDKGGKAFDSLEDFNIPRGRKEQGPSKIVNKKGNKAPAKRVAALSDIPDSGPITGKDANVTGILGEIDTPPQLRRKKGESDDDLEKRQDASDAAHALKRAALIKKSDELKESTGSSTQDLIDELKASQASSLAAESARDKQLDSFMEADNEGKVKVLNSLTDEDKSELLSDLYWDKDFDSDVSTPEIKRIADKAESNLRKKEKIKANKLIDPKKTWYRGTQTKGHGFQNKPEYATFLTDNINQAATYAGRDGYISEVLLDADSVKEFNKSDSNFNQFTKLDDDARKLYDREALLVHNVVDRGYFKDGLLDELNGTGVGQNVAIRNSKIAKVIKQYKAKNLFEELEEDDFF